MNHDYKQTDIAEWSDTYTCQKCGVSWTYDAEDCMSAKRLNELDTSECKPPVAEGEKK